jgi:uncharacterized protein YndB with AHSA1/START domain
MSKTRDIDIQIVIENPAARVFDAWLNPNLLERWLTHKANVQREVGGKYELFWDEKNMEHNSTRGCTITELVPDREISFSWRGPQQYAELMKDHTQVFIRLEPQEEGGTLLRFIHTGWGAGPEWDKAREWQAEAWQEAIENLKNMLENTERFLQNVSMN